MEQQLLTAKLEQTLGKLLLSNLQLDASVEALRQANHEQSLKIQELNKDEKSEVEPV